MLDSYMLVLDPLVARAAGIQSTRPSPTVSHSGLEVERPRTLESVLEENARLREQLALQSKGSAYAETLARENALLASAVMQFKQDVQSQALRYKVSDSLRFSSLHPTAPRAAAQSGMSRMDEQGGADAERVRGLEREVRQLRLENDGLVRSGWVYY